MIDQIARPNAHVLQARRVRLNRLAELTARDRDRRAIRFEVDDRRALVVLALQRDGIEQRMELRTIGKGQHDDIKRSASSREYTDANDNSAFICVHPR